MSEAFKKKRFTLISLKEGKKLLEHKLLNSIFLQALQVVLCDENSIKQEVLPLVHFPDIYAALNSMVVGKEEKALGELGELPKTQKMLTEALAKKLDVYFAKIKSDFTDRGYNAVANSLDFLIKVLNIFIAASAAHKKELFEIKIRIVSLLFILKKIELSYHEQKQNQEPKLVEKSKNKQKAEISPLDSIIHYAQKSHPDVFRIVAEFQREIIFETPESKPDIKKVRLPMDAIGKAFEDKRRENKLSYVHNPKNINRKNKNDSQDDDQEKNTEACLDKPSVSSVIGNNNTINSHTTFAIKETKKLKVEAKNESTNSYATCRIQNEEEKALVPRRRGF